MVSGTAYPLGGGFYLTARHIVVATEPDNEIESVFVRLAPGAELIEGKVAWSPADDEFDVAVLEVPDGRVVPDGDLRWGRLRGTAVHDCDAVGFPDFAIRETYVSGKARLRWELERAKGTVVLPTGSDADTLAFDVANPPPSSGNGSAWQGMSGAPLYSRGLFVGLIVQSPPALRDRRLLAVPAHAIARDRDFAQFARARIGRGIELVDLEATETQTVADAAIQEVARTDPRNIQEVAAAQFGLSDAYYTNVLSQARRSFAAAVVAASIGLLFFLGAVASALLARPATSAAVVSTVGGAVVEVVAGLNFWLYSRTSTQLNAFHIRLERMQKYLLANSVCANIAAERRDEVMADLVRTIATEVAEAPDPVELSAASR